MSAQHQELREYGLDDYNLFTGFSSFEDASIYASENGGEVVEVAFTDGNDNPQISTEAGLVENKRYFYVNAGPEYKFIHSTDPEFQEYGEKLKDMEESAKTSSPEEQYFADFR